MEEGNALRPWLGIWGVEYKGLCFETQGARMEASAGGCVYNCVWVVRLRGSKQRGECRGHGSFYKQKGKIKVNSARAKGTGDFILDVCPIYRLIVELEPSCFRCFSY